MQVCSRSQSFETICISVGLVYFSKFNFVCNALNKLISQSVLLMQQSHLYMSYANGKNIRWATDTCTSLIVVLLAEEKCHLRLQGPNSRRLA